MQAVTETVLLLLFAGWQPRWFLLCGGILSYYDSPEDAWKGCKGSIQMAVCEIQGEKPTDLQVFFFFLSPTKRALASACLSLTFLRYKDTQCYVPKKALQIRPKTAANFYKEVVEEVVKINESSVLHHTSDAHFVVTCSPKASNYVQSLLSCCFFFFTAVSNTSVQIRVHADLLTTTTHLKQANT